MKNSDEYQIPPPELKHLLVGEKFLAHDNGAPNGRRLIYQVPIDGTYEIYGERVLPLIIEVAGVGPCIPVDRLLEHHIEILKILDKIFSNVDIDN